VRVASLGSGSKGNATLVQSGECRVLVDCGFSLREVQRRCAALNFDPGELDAIFVTHEHSDHGSGVAALSRRYRIPVYLTHGTLASGRLDGCAEYRLFDADSSLALCDLAVQAVAVPHDAREPVQYRFDSAGVRVGLLTDLGSVTAHVCASFRDCDLLLLEFNHDRDMLAAGPYPAALKRRVGGDWGHLSNQQAVELLAQLRCERLQHLVVAHISEQNNQRSRVEEALAGDLPELLPKLRWAAQTTGFPWLCVAGPGAERAASPSLALDAGIGAY
jgi:phosphoribosyl 1,2-cyclic phosphodiesterase